MIDWVGPIPSAAVSPAVGLVLAAPIAGAIIEAAVGSRVSARARASVAAALSLIGVGVAAAFGARASDAPGATLLAPGYTLARFGQLDLTTALALDPFAATLSALLALSAAIAFAVAASRTTALASRAVVGAHVAIAFATLALIADDAPVAIAGWAASAVALSLTSKRMTLSAAAALACALAMAASSTSAWSVAGGWSGGEYTPAIGPRFAAVRASSQAPPPARPRDPDGDDDDEWEPVDESSGSLTLVATSGATVYLDDARSPIAHAPFARVAVPGGKHTVRVHPGDGADDTIVTTMSFGGGREVELVPLGATFSPRVLALELALHDSLGDRPLYAALVARAGFLPVAVATLAACLVALSALARLFAVAALGDAPIALCGVGASVIGAPAIAFITRARPLFVASPLAVEAGALAAGVAALAMAIAAIRSERASDAATHAVGAQLAIACAAACAGAPGPAMLHLVMTALTAAALAAGIGRLAVAVPVFSAVACLEAVFAMRAAPPAGTLVFFAASTALALATNAVVRHERPTTGGRRTIAAAAALAVGPLLGGSRRMIGEDATPLFERLLGARVARPDAEARGAVIEIAIAALAIGLVVYAWFRASRREGGRAQRRGRADRGAGMLERVASVVLAVDRRAIEALGQALTGVARRIAARRR